MRFDPRYTYRMPVAFGPMPGPRQALPGCGPRGSTASVTTLTLRFRTTEQSLDELLPPCFELSGEPIVTVEYSELSDVPWLAGRGYDTFAIKVPVQFEGARDRVTGSFVAVVWENSADPIITGRDELGYAKLFADLHSSTEQWDKHRCMASWDGHIFAELELENITEVPPEVAPQQDGVLHFRYVPGVEAGAGPDFVSAVLTPAVDGVEVTRQATATGRVHFVKSSWQQLPTFYNVVNALARLPVVSYEECVVRHSRRSIENRGQKRLV